MKKNSDKENMSTKKNKGKIGAVKLAVIILLVIGIAAVAVTLIKSVVMKKRADKTVRVAFYGLSQEYCELLKEKIPVEEGITLICETLSEGAIDLGAIKEKYDMLFTWKGEITDALEDSSEPIPAKILDIIPSSLRNEKCAPIFMDHCELAYSKDVVEKNGGNLPTSFPSFLTYINNSKAYVFSPFFCNGAEDRVLTAFVGNIIESIGGTEAYSKLIEELRKETPFDELLDIQLTQNELTLRSILDPLKKWPTEGYAHPGWFDAYGNDLLFFTQSDHVAVFYTFLHDHRKFQYDIISKYEAFLMPPSSSTIEYGIIAPAVCVMLISDNSNAKRYIQEFFTEEAQKDFSEKTKLAPVHSRVQAYDRQADDVRYWAASCPAGALPDLYLAAFQRKPAAHTEFARKIRNYLK